VPPAVDATHFIVGQLLSIGQSAMEDAALWSVSATTLWSVIAQHSLPQQMSRIDIMMLAAATGLQNTAVQ
jgi:hypothetical protein